MWFSIQKTFLLISFLAGSLFVSQAAFSQSASGSDSSRLNLMVQVVTSADTPEELRRDAARNLLLDPAGHEALVEVLRHEDNANAKIIICQVIAGSKNSFNSLGLTHGIHKDFSDPLFVLLQSEQVELARAAAHALAQCRNGVPDRLAKIAGDAGYNIHSRAAAIEALTLIPGRKSVLALAGVLDDPEPRIAARAAEALADTLYLQKPLNLEQFRTKVLPRVKDMNSEQFLFWQSDLRLTRILSLEHELDQSQQMVSQWRELYFKSEKDKFDQIKESERKLEFLKPFLNNTRDDMLRIWALERANEWSKSATVRNGPITQALVEALAMYVADSHPQVRRLTALTLAELDFQTARVTAPALLEQLSREDDPNTQAALLSALGTFEYIPVLDQVLEKLASSPHPQVVSQAVRAVGRISGTQAKDIPVEQMKAIIPELAHSYERWSGHTELKGRIIETMQKIVGQEKFRQSAVNHFEAIVVRSLQDESPEVRTHAVYALPEVVNSSQLIPALINDRFNLFNDPDNSVRFAVLVCLEQYGNQKHLKLLDQRMAEESDPDILLRMETTFIKLLSRLAVKDIVDWAKQLKDNDGPAHQHLRQMVLRHLMEEIKAMKAAGQSPDSESQAYVLQEMAGIAIQKQQYDQAIRNYHKLLSLPGTEEIKQSLRDQIVKLCMDVQDEGQLSGLSPMVRPILKSEPVLYDHIIRAFQPGSSETQLIHQVFLINALVLPVEDLPEPQLQQQWRQHINQLAAVIVDQLEKKLSENGSPSEPLLQSLSKLDGRFKDYPAGASVEKQIEALQGFRDLINVPIVENITSEPAASNN